MSSSMPLRSLRDPFRPQSPIRTGLAAALAAVLGCGAASAQEPERAFRVVPLDALNTRPRTPQSLPTGSLLNISEFASLDESTLPFVALGSGSRPNADTVLQLLEAQGRLSLEGSMSVSPQRSRIDLAGPGREVGAAAAAVQTVLDAVLQPIHLELSVYEWRGDAPPPARLDAQGWERTFGNQTEVSRNVTRVSSGARAALGRLMRMPYVPDLDVEVASDASIHDPKVKWLSSGLQMQVEAHRLNSEGKIALLGHLVLGELEAGIPSRSTGDDDMPAMDAPTISMANVSCSGVVQAGGGFTVSVRRDDGWVVVALRAKLVGDAGLVRQAGLVATSALATQSFGVPASGVLTGRTLASPQGADDIFSERAKPVAVLDRRPLDMLMGIAEVESLSNGFLEMNGYAGVLGKVDEVQRVADYLKSLEQAHLSTTTWTIQGGDGITLVQAPAMLGRHVHAVLGKEWIEVYDYNVEIAQEATARNPLSRAAFTGLRMVALPTAHGGELHLRTELEIHDAEGTRRRHGGNKSADLFFVDRGYQNVRWQGTISGDEAIDLGGTQLGPMPKLRWSKPAKL